MPRYQELPGQELVDRGIADLRTGHRSAAGLLVSMARTRLAAAGIDVPAVSTERPGHALFDLLASEDPAAAHGRYNALIRRLVSYLRAAEHARAR
jgi:hypothetical protein